MVSSAAFPHPYDNHRHLLSTPDPYLSLSTSASSTRKSLFCTSLWIFRINSSSRWRCFLVFSFSGRKEEMKLENLHRPPGLFSPHKVTHQKLTKLLWEVSWLRLEPTTSCAGLFTTRELLISLSCWFLMLGKQKNVLASLHLQPVLKISSEGCAFAAAAEPKMTAGRAEGSPLSGGAGHFVLHWIRYMSEDKNTTTTTPQIVSSTPYFSSHLRGTSSNKVGMFFMKSNSMRTVYHNSLNWCKKKKNM